MKKPSEKIINRIYAVCMIIAATMALMSVFICMDVNLGRISADYIRDMAVDVMGMFTGCILLVGVYTGNREDKQNRSMFRIIFVLVALLFGDLVSSVIEGKPEFVSLILAVNTFSFILEDALGYTYWTYIRDELDVTGKLLKVTDIICRTALAVTVVLDLLNIKFGWFFTVSEAGEYVDSPMEALADIAIMVVFVIAAILIISNKLISVNEKLILLSFETFPFVAYIIGSITRVYTWNYPAFLLSVLLIYIRIFSQRGKKVAEQQAELLKQGTALMISQIQPHFLYNVLTTISNLCATDPEEAEETTVLFSQYLRTNLDSLRNQDTVPFATELSHIRTYVELEKKRFGDILNVEYDIKEVNFKVPSLGLQPIVENSIKHGIRGKNAPGHIRIATQKVPEGYEIIIEDDGVGFDMNAPVPEDGRSHVGMTNVKERLRRMCNASTKIESSPGQGCCTRIIIPEEN